MITELTTQHDSRKSFYGKAKVIVEGNKISLQSYTTIVAEISNGVAKVFGTYSPTTLRHIKEFLQQNNFEIGTSKQIMEMYGVEEWKILILYKLY